MACTPKRDLRIEGNVVSLGLALTKNFLAKQTKLRPKFAIVLGSGFGEAVDWLKVEKTLDYADHCNFRGRSVAGHHGQGLLGIRKAAWPWSFSRGRAHYYEGLTMRDAAFRLSCPAIGASIFIVTNAAGGIIRTSPQAISCSSATISTSWGITALRSLELHQGATVRRNARCV